MTRRVLAARLNGSLGGKQGSLHLSDEQREERARKAGNGTLNRYGLGYYSFLGSKPRKHSTSKTIQEPVKISKASLRFAGMMR